MPREPEVKRRRLKLPWSPRTLAIQIPLHLLAFALLYVAVFQLTVHEVVRTYEAESGAFLAEAAASLHTAMVCYHSTDRRQRLQALAASRKQLGLGIFSASGRPVAPDLQADPRVAAFLASGKDEDTVIGKEGRDTTLTAMTRVRTTAACEPCHARDSVAGVLIVRRKLTGSLSATRRRTALGLALLVGGWLGLVGVVNVATRRFATASVDALKARVETGSSRAAGSGGAPLGMDSLSHELYLSLEKTLREHHEERTAMESRLENAEHMASMGRLAAGLAHEIKNPLAGVQGALELLVEECRNDERISLYRRMLEELRRVNETLHSLLHFARPRKPRRVRTEIPSLVEDIAELARAGFSQRNIALITTVDPGIGTFVLDPAQIRQVLVNLITNAADAVGTAGRIELVATPFPHGDGLILAVADDGQGMDKATQREIFDPFFTTKLHGTGLGLTVARRIIEEHEGTVEISSAPGRGTTVFLLLPDPDRTRPPSTEEES